MRPRFVTGTPRPRLTTPNGQCWVFSGATAPVSLYELPHLSGIHHPSPSVTLLPFPFNRVLVFLF